MCEALGLPDNTDTIIVRRLKCALVKSSTQDPMGRTPALPMKAFITLLRQWGSNDQLTLAQLRTKTVTLLALTLMLRPSDIAPASVQFNPDTLDKIQDARYKDLFRLGG